MSAGEQHVMYVRELPVWNGYQTTCSCKWESEPQVFRPEAVREHVVHVFDTKQAALR